ncbi:pirin family protein [Sphingobium phenoxybenzoativorans]|uniref:pirin family protein n=1 Tax=Sphingobium phenoxybenzoativorans TaxID=1592790 RepID=UPI0008731EE1|nr:pirin family protein [Sphingobium phenoxybenzoativorans]
MIEHRPFAHLFGGDRGWLKAKVHFLPSDVTPFAKDDRNRLFGTLLAWSDDEISPRSGFPMHPHSDLEIVTYVRDGTITHQDTLGNKGRIAAGEVQVTSAGAGIRHSEVNADDELARLFQIWFQPRTSGGSPQYSGRTFPTGKEAGKFVILASGDPADTDALKINADARVLNAALKGGETLVRPMARGTRGYLVPTTGRVAVNGWEIGPRDGAAIHDEATISVKAIEDTEIILVELITDVESAPKADAA